MDTDKGTHLINFLLKFYYSSDRNGRGKESGKGNWI